MRRCEKLLSLGLLHMAAAIVAATASGAEDSMARKDGERLTLAHCMSCCSVSVALPALKGEKNEPPAWKLPVGGALPEMVKYTYDPLGAAKEEVRLAKQAGIDAFGLFNNGYITGPQKQFAKQTEAYWQAAQEDGVFKIFPEVWTVPDENYLQVTADEFAYLKSKYDSSWLRIDGKRVVFIAEQRGLLPKGVSPKEAVDKLLAPLGGRDAVYVAISANPRPEDFDYSYAWRPKPPAEGWMPLTDAMINWWCHDYGNDAKARKAMDKFNASAGNKDIWTRVMPSFFVLRPSWGPYAVERLGPAGFYENWMSAIERKSRAAYIVTWNDSSEDSGVLPDVNHGYAYLELTKYFSSWFKNGKRPSVEKEQILLFHHPQLTETPMKLPPESKVAARHNSQATPPTDYIAVVTMLKEEAEVRIDLQSYSDGAQRYETLAKRKFPAGVNFWLVYHPLKSASDSAVKNFDDVNVPKPLFDPVYPEERDDFAITKLAEPLKARVVYVGVERGGKLEGFFRSQRTIDDAAGKANLATIGNVFPLEEGKAK